LLRQPSVALAIVAPRAARRRRGLLCAASIPTASTAARVTAHMQRVVLLMMAVMRVVRLRMRALLLVLRVRLVRIVVKAVR